MKGKDIEKIVKRNIEKSENIVDYRCAFCGKYFKGRPFETTILGPVIVGGFGNGDEEEIIGDGAVVCYCSHGCYIRGELTSHIEMGMSEDEAIEHIAEEHEIAFEQVESVLKETEGRCVYCGSPRCGEEVRKGKVGRNEPCPCGSGKKYKKCCGRGF